MLVSRTRFNEQFDWSANLFLKRAYCFSREHRKHVLSSADSSSRSNAFLEVENGQLETDSQECRMCVYVFGAVYSPRCANFPLQQIAEHFKNYYDPVVVNIVKRSFYVGDCLATAPPLEMAKTLLFEFKNLLKKSDFNIVKRTRNNR